MSCSKQYLTTRTKTNQFLLVLLTTVAVDVVTVTSTTHSIYTVCTFIYNANHIHTPLVLTVRIPSARSALPCVSFTLSCVSVCFRNIHTTRPCDLRRHAHCAARSPVNHWPAPATRRRRRRRGSNSACSQRMLQQDWNVSLKDTGLQLALWLIRKVKFLEPGTEAKWDSALVVQQCLSRSVCWRRMWTVSPCLPLQPYEHPQRFAFNAHNFISVRNNIYIYAFIHFIYLFIYYKIVHWVQYKHIKEIWFKFKVSSENKVWSFRWSHPLYRQIMRGSKQLKRGHLT